MAEGAIVLDRLPSGLLRALGTAFAFSVALGNMVGSGIFRSPGLLVGHAGTVTLALVLIVGGALHALLSANLWAEVSTSVPLSGGSVVVARRALGDTAALIIGWTDGLSAVAGIAQGAAAAAGFAALLLPGIAMHLGTAAAAFLVLFALVNWRGVVVGEVALMVTCAIQGFLIIALICVLVWLARLPPEQHGTEFHPLGLASLLIGYQLVYGTFVGWNNAGYFSEEANDPGRSVPRGMAISIVCFAALYIAMMLALAASLPLAQLSGAEFPAGLVIKRALGGAGALVLAAFAFVALLGGMNAGFMPATRILYALGRLRYAPVSLARVNRGGTPDLALFLLAALAVILVLTGRYETIFILMGTLVMAVTTAMDIAFFALRLREPSLNRPFKALGYPGLPILAIVLDVCVLVGVAVSDLKASLYGLLAVIVGVVAARLTARWRTADSPQ